MTYIRGIMPFRNVPVLGGRLSLGDLIFAAILAFILTYLVQKMSSSKLNHDGDSDSDNDLSNDVNNILQRCYTLFPIETVIFHGETFTRGALVKIRTIKNRTFEGRLIGRNSDNIVCIMTRSFIAADMLENIVEIETLGSDH